MKYAEIIEECGFWMRETGDSRKPSNNITKELYWLVRSCLKFLIIYILNGKKWNYKNKDKCNGLLLYLTKNQQKAIQSILEKRENLSLLTASNQKDADVKIPWGRYGIIGFRCILIVYFLIRKNEHREKLIPWLDECVSYFAGKQIGLELFEIKKTKCLIFSNDHSGVSRGIISAARNSGVKLIYTQHAVVGKDFPALKYDLSLLDGYQALINYQNSGEIQGVVAITGRQKIKSKIKKVDNKIVIGCATNPYDNVDEWDEIFNEIRKIDAKIIIRLHPRERRIKKWDKALKKNGIECNRGSLQDFIDMTDVTISGLSGFSLDSAIRGVPNITIKPTNIKSQRMIDYYSFVEYGITEECKRISDLNEIIKKKINLNDDELNFCIYEAGCVVDPDLKKYELIKKFIENNFDCSALKSKLTKNEINGQVVFDSSEYCNLLNEKLGIQ